MKDKNVPTMNNKSVQGSHMIGGRTYRNVPTTNNTEPIKPDYPAVRKSAMGPLLTTSNVEAKRDVEDMSKDAPEEARQKPGRPKKA